MGMARFEHRVAIVTGAAGAIGTEIARRLGSEGARLVLADANGQRLAERRDELDAELHTDPVAVAGDLSEPETAAAITAAGLERFGQIDVLVNNAGGGVIRPTLDHTEDTLQATIARNLWTALRATIAVVPVMRAAGYGRVVFVGADSVRNGLDDHAVYNAAKGGVHAFARGLAREHARDGITFNTVAPCATATPELAEILTNRPELGDAFVRVIPMGRPAAMAEVASAVAYLASEEAGFITGQVLGVNGGSTMN